MAAGLEPPLDSAFEIPGTRIRFGWDPILGLLPWVGDMVSPLFSIAIVVTAMQLGIPRSCRRGCC